MESNKLLKCRTRSTANNKPAQSLLKAVGGKLVFKPSSSFHQIKTLDTNGDSDFGVTASNITGKTNKNARIRQADEEVTPTCNGPVSNSEASSKEPTVNSKKSTLTSKGKPRKRKVLVFRDEPANDSLPVAKRRKTWVGGVLVDSGRYPELLSDKRREVRQLTKKNNELLNTVGDKMKSLREGLRVWNCMIIDNIPESRTLLELIGELHQAKGINKLIHKVIAGDGVLTLKNLEKEMMKIMEESERVMD